MYRDVRITSKTLRFGDSVGNFERLVCCNGTGVYGRKELPIMAVWRVTLYF